MTEMTARLLVPQSLIKTLLTEGSSYIFWVTEFTLSLDDVSTEILII